MTYRDITHLCAVGCPVYRDGKCNFEISEYSHNENEMSQPESVTVGQDCLHPLMFSDLIHARRLTNRLITKR